MEATLGTGESTTNHYQFKIKKIKIKKIKQQTVKENY